MIAGRYNYHESAAIPKEIAALGSAAADVDGASECCHGGRSGGLRKPSPFNVYKYLVLDSLFHQGW
jgi:hypothetical protein